MYRPRVIPVLLLKNKGLVKSERFKTFRYIGDPINAVKIFNDLRADELVFLDILASKEKRTISTEFVKNVGDEANMPFAVGGGIRSLGHISEIIAAGAEKIVINTYAVENPQFILEAANEFGSSTIVVSMDIKKKRFGKQQLFIYSGSKASGYDPIDFAKLAEEKGAGELLLNSIEGDGQMLGYDLELIQKVSDAVGIPVVACGGAGKLKHLKDAVETGHASAVAAGSMFVYHGERRAVLVNYPQQKELIETFN